MKLSIRKIGNSLGIIIPKAALDTWGVAEGDQLHLSEGGIHPPSGSASSHEALDELKRKLASAVVACCTTRQIRAQGLANLHRWKASGVWVSAYDEWNEILRNPDDGVLFSAMLGRDERSVRLRQSPPYVGLLPRRELRRLNEEAAR
jgi:antitoxin component of MazEF toxin-antitoxin module